MTFDDQISDFWKKASREMYELAKVRPYMNLLKKLMNAFFNSKFSYPLTWMCHSRANDNKAKGLHERFLRIMYFESHRMKRCWKRTGPAFIHNRNHKIVDIEICNVTKFL